MEEFYVYCHKNPESKEIFYVGKGTGNRAYTIYNRGKHWNNYVKKYGFPIVEFLYVNLTEEEALQKESHLIMEIGRKELNKGPLVNSTDGGEGCSGMRHTEESKKKISESHTGKPSHRKGVKMSDEFRQMMRAKMLGSKRGKYKTRKDKGKTFSAEIRKKFKDAQFGKKPILQFDKDGNFIKEWGTTVLAESELKINGIGNVLDKPLRKCGGFIWKRKY